VVVQLEDLEKNKEEMHKLLNDVKRELSVSDDELEEEPVVVIRREKLKVCLGSPYGDLSTVKVSYLKDFEN